MTTSMQPNSDSAPVVRGEEIYGLIPQRPPVLEVDTVWEISESSAETGLSVSADNIFVSGGKLRENGIIEHVAQSAAAFAGYDIWRQGLSPRLGYIAEIKKFHIEALPPVGATLRTRLDVRSNDGGMTLLQAKVLSDGEEIASGQMKIYLKDE